MWRCPEPGDIVWCRFPERPRDIPGPKPRPALVLSVTERDDGVSIVVAYGTSKKLDRLTAGEFAIRAQADRAAYVMAGLSFDTKFNLAKSIELPWNDSFFAVPSDVPHGQTPKLGSLHIGMRRALEAAARAARRV